MYSRNEVAINDIQFFNIGKVVLYIRVPSGAIAAEKI